MATIEIKALAKSYRVYQKKEGLGAAISGLFRREYRLVEAVRGIDLTVEQGEFVAFLGPNGAGKTTTLKLLSGVITPTTGTARVLGYVPWRRENAYRRRFALVMGQKNQLWWDLPAAESFRLHQHIYRIELTNFEHTLGELTEMLEVGNLLSQPVRELSLGERMKMELIAALLHSPDVLFLDEPTIGLDVVAQHNIQVFLREYQQAPQGHDLADEPLYERRGRALPPRGDHCLGKNHLRRIAWRASSTGSAAIKSFLWNSPTAKCQRASSDMEKCFPSSRRKSSCESPARRCPTFLEIFWPPMPSPT